MLKHWKIRIQLPLSLDEGHRLDKELKENENSNQINKTLEFIHKWEEYLGSNTKELLQAYYYCANILMENNELNEACEYFEKFVNLATLYDPTLYILVLRSIQCILHCNKSRRNSYSSLRDWLN